MATSESRSTFRLPWISDRSAEERDRFNPVEPDPEAGEGDPGGNEAVAPTWADAEIVVEPGFSSAAPEPPESVAAPAPVAMRKPTKLMVDLATAIRATTEAARDNALAVVAVDATEVIGAIRAASTEGTETLRRRSDEDLAGIKEWSKAEIARIREQTETRIAARKAMLDTKLTAYASAVEHRIGEVDGAVARYRADMDAYFGTLTLEEDPSRLATMAEAMPEPLELDAWKDITDLDLTAHGAEAIAVPQTLEAETVEAGTVEVEATTGMIEPEAAQAPEATIEATIEAVATSPEVVESSLEPEATAEGIEPGTAEPTTPWDVPDDSWATGTPESAESGDPVDRAAIMAAIEAAAEAVVAAESAAESASQAEAAADVAETAVGLISWRTPEDEAADAQAVMTARVDAGGFDAVNLTDRLARLLPSIGAGATDGEPCTTQVVVTGLVSVASIASFKRHLGRVVGVQAVGVASGPGGEFVFHVTHRPDVSFRDAIPSMPGFAARVTGTGDGVVSVTARDPEAEG
jgi:hypothetical protein